jgi:thymidylate synthase
MRIYRNCREMYSEVKRDLHEMGTLVHPQTMQDKIVADDPNYRTLELSPYTFTILDGSDRTQWLSDIKYNIDWCLADFEERVSTLRGGIPINPGEAWKLRAETWSEFIHDGKFAYTYSDRLGQSFASAPDDTPNVRKALPRVVAELGRHPNTRQAVLPIFDPVLDIPRLGSSQRVPCSLYYQFLRRDDGLRVIYAMRSSDLITHFPYDIWMALQLQHAVAQILEIPSERFIFFTGSLHLYAKDADPGVF